MKGNSDKKKDDDQAAVERIRKSRITHVDVLDLARLVIEGNRAALSRAITLIESQHPEDQKNSALLMRSVLPHSGKSFRVGITGVPGAGKSTFIEAFGTYLTGQNRKVAVLTVDPSSDSGKGSILGDKTRMELLSANPDAYIRPSPGSGNLGGVARKTRETIFLCEAAGFDTILIETIGVGQSETAVHSMSDFFILITIAGAGDELQGIKRGIMEFADLVLVNKADGENIQRAKLARQEIARALHFFREQQSGWTAVAEVCSALESTGITEAWNVMLTFQERSLGSGWFTQNRNNQTKWWLNETLKDELSQAFFLNPKIQKMLPGLEEQLLKLEISNTEAAKKLIGIFRISE